LKGIGHASILILLTALALRGPTPAAAAAARSTLAPAKERALVQEAETARAGRHFKRAARRYNRLAAAALAPDLRAEYATESADCLFLAGKLYQAYSGYKDVITDLTLHAAYEHVLERLRTLAERFNRGEGTFMGIRNRALAIEIYDLIMKKAPAGQRAPADAYRLAQIQMDAGLQEDAILTYRDLVKRFPTAPEAADGRLELGRVLLELAQRGDGDGSLIRQARRELEAFLAEFPDHPRRAEAELLHSLVLERQAQALLDLGEFYLSPAHRRVPAARRYLHDAARAYADTHAAVIAKLILAQVDALPAEVAPTTAAPQTAPVPGAEPGGVLVPAAEMTPDKVRASGSERQRPVGALDDVQKWLLPLDDFGTDTGEDT